MNGIVLQESAKINVNGDILLSFSLSIGHQNPTVGSFPAISNPTHQDSDHSGSTRLPKIQPLPL
ncbi:hypothetical protein YC2023_044249 [Brassica napus]